MKENMKHEFIMNNNLLPRREYNNITPVISKEFYISLSYDNIKEYEEKYDKYLIWNLISASGKLTESDIVKNADKINWRTLIKHQRVSEYILVKFREKIDWEDAFMYQDLSSNNIASYQLDEDGNISQFTHTIKYLSNEFITNVEDNMNLEAWDALIRYQYVEEETIMKYLSKTLGNKGLLFAGVDPNYYIFNICRYQYLSENMIDNILAQTLINANDRSDLMEIISEKQLLTERQMDKYKDELSWQYITPNLSEDLLIKFKDYINWAYVAVHSDKYSEGFLSDMSFYLDKYNF